VEHAEQVLGSPEHGSEMEMGLFEIEEMIERDGSVRTDKN